ncbi:MAG: NAD(P)/FAD-dependent oxidoreductase, partial [Chloroflexota bacterium]
FSRYARQVIILARASALEKGMSQYLVDQIRATPNIAVWLHTEVVAAQGENKLEAVVVRHIDREETETIAAAALFIFIGATAHSELVAGVVERDRAGFILTGRDLFHDSQRPAGWPLKRDPFLLETNVPGVFAVGDVRHGSIKRVASAVGEGAAAVQLAHQYLKTV